MFIISEKKRIDTGNSFENLAQADREQGASWYVLHPDDEGKRENILTGHKAKLSGHITR